jgi:cell wall-associated NlpC family hydrolase
MVSEALLGEEFHVFEVKGKWAWGQLAGDGYVGYVAAGGLAAIEVAPTHGVCVPSTFIFPEASVKSGPVRPAWLNARVTVVGEEGSFARLAGGGYVYRAHLAGLDDHAADFVAVAERFLNVPYLWGGRTFRGLDCSGLVQTAMHAAGRPCPRDSDMIEATVGEPLPKDRLDLLRRGDLVFWKGHVGIMVDGVRLLHSNGHHMLTVIEPIAEAVARIAATGSPVTSLRRP